MNLQEAGEQVLTSPLGESLYGKPGTAVSE